MPNLCPPILILTAAPERTPGLIYLEASTLILDQGRVEVIPGDKITNLLMRSLIQYPREYSKIAVSSLALFTRAFFKHAKTDGMTHDH